MIGTQLTLFQSFPVPDPNWPSMDDYDYENDDHDNGYDSNDYDIYYDSLDEYMYDDDDR